MSDPRYFYFLELWRQTESIRSTFQLTIESVESAHSPTTTATTVDPQTRVSDLTELGRLATVAVAIDGGSSTDESNATPGNSQQLTSCESWFQHDAAAQPFSYVLTPIHFCSLTSAVATAVTLTAADTAALESTGESAFAISPVLEPRSRTETQ